MRAAIVHYWLLNQRGGEKVFDALCRLLPGGRYLHPVLRPRHAQPRDSARIASPPPFSTRCAATTAPCCPLMPMALESFDLRGYDLVVSSESGPAKGVITSSTHTPHLLLPHPHALPLGPLSGLSQRLDALALEARRHDTDRQLPAPLGLSLRPRAWTASSPTATTCKRASGRPTAAKARSSIRRSTSIRSTGSPPKTISWPSPNWCRTSGRFAVRWFSATGRRLKIAGAGPEYASLRTMAASNVEFLGRVGDAELRELYARCRAFLLPGEEDFGITPVEALASGKPVVALGRGGALETVPEFGGVFYAEPAEFGGAIERLERLEPSIRPAELQAWARQFSEEEFLRKMGAVLETPSIVQLPDALPRRLR